MNKNIYFPSLGATQAVFESWFFLQIVGLTVQFSILLWKFKYEIHFMIYKTVFRNSWEILISFWNQN